jgi:hypothetical protein
MIRLVSLLGLSFALTTACLLPNFEVVHSHGEVRLDFQSLGEYPSTVGMIRVSESASGRVAWEVRARRPYPKLWGVSLRPGKNPSQLRSAGNRPYEVIVPRTGVFILNRGVSYRVEVWAEPDGRRATAMFIFSETE